MAAALMMKPLIIIVILTNRKHDGDVSFVLYYTYAVELIPSGKFAQKPILSLPQQSTKKSPTI
jgi:hypothetical protein